MSVRARPSIQVTRSWQYTDAVTRDRTGQLTAEVRDAINRLLSALDEPQLLDPVRHMQTEAEMGTPMPIMLRTCE